MPQPDLHREGYAIFVRCCSLRQSTSGELVATIRTLDRILSDQIRKKDSDFFPNPYGGAIYCQNVAQALNAARDLIRELGSFGISAAIGVAWGRFQRTNNVRVWNAASIALNEAARLAFCPAAVGRVFVSPHFRNNAANLVVFGKEKACTVKDKPYRYHEIVSPDYQQQLTFPLVSATPHTEEMNIVLWDIVKYSTKEPDEQAALSNSLALSATTLLHTFGAKVKDYSPAGDGGFAVFTTGLQALTFARELGKYALFDGIAIRIGIHQGPVTTMKRGPVGPSVLLADAMCANAPPGGIAILADIWRNLDRVARSDWWFSEIGSNMIVLEPVRAGVSEPLVRAIVSEAPVRAVVSETPSLAHLVIPPLPANYVERPEALARLRSKLLSPTRGSTIALTAVDGMGGIGKTVLAEALSGIKPSGMRSPTV